MARAAVLLGVTPAELRRFEQGESWPDVETYDRICNLFGWAQSFEGGRAR